MRTHARRLAALLGLALVGVGLAGAAPSDPRPPGRLVDVGGYRLHIQTAGKGSATVVFLNGAGDYSFVWALVQPEVARFARTVTYDRAGDAWSDLGPTPRSMRQESYELHLLLAKTGTRPPYVLVGHSYGGLLARVFAAEYPAEVAGMVLVDATHENTVLFMNGKLTRMRELASARPVPPIQTMKSSPPKPPTAEDIKQAEEMRKMFGPPKIEPPFDRLPADAQRLQLWAAGHQKLSASADTYFAEELQRMYTERQTKEFPLGDMPLVDLVGGKGSMPADPPEGVTAERWREIVEEKRAQKADLAQLSHKGRLVVDDESGHHIHLENPKLVVDSIRGVVDDVRRSKR